MRNLRGLRDKNGKPVLGQIAKVYVDEVGNITTERDQIVIPMRVKDVREAYGRVDFLVEPVMGSGDCWVSADRLVFAELPTMTAHAP